uniref:Transposase n=1 Tax=Bombyx mori TaxID=7091 RepID=O18341_BOMMO|nr:transposase [Bombyx mori]
MENMKYRYIYEYQFYRGTSAAETTQRINDVYGAGVAKESTVRFWFQRFRSGNFDLQNQPRGRPETKVKNEELKAIVEADQSQSTSEIVAGFGVSDKTVLIHLKQIGKVKKLERWVPHELSESNLQTRIDCCVTLLNRHYNEGILNRINTCDEKGVLYDNRKRLSQWLNPGDPAKSYPKRKLTQKKLLVSVWWTSIASVVHYSFLKSGQTITADIYCQQLQTMKEELAAKQPRLVNRSRPLLLHDNARPHTAQQTTTKLDELQLACLRHPPYSDLAPIDYHFFLNLDNFLQKKINSDAAVQTAFKEFIDSRYHGFFSKGINELPKRLQKCIDNNGAYFD